jgi:hypothetical protein
MSTMQEAEFRDYIAPTVTHIASQGMYVFGFRFGFTSRNPLSWKGQEQTKEATSSVGN